MSNKEYELAIVIGRFRPFHTGHYELLLKAKAIADETLVIIGSSKTPRSIKNPWIATEVKSMILNAVHDREHIKFAFVPDFTYNDADWVAAVEGAVSCNTAAKKIAVVGHGKDYSSRYLNFFPQWTYVPVDKPVTVHDVRIDATEIRDAMFSMRTAKESLSTYLAGRVHMTTQKFIMNFVNNSELFNPLVEEWIHVQEYKASWANTPYPPTFVTVDSVVIQSGHVLLIQRGEQPGKGLWAMPGGFIGQYELLEDSAVRELREETGLKVPEKVLHGSIRGREVFDDPGRSTRGRTITTAFLFKLDDAEKLPRVKGGDDARHAQWFSFSEVKGMQEAMFEDHYAIVQKMVSKA